MEVNYYGEKENENRIFINLGIFTGQHLSLSGSSAKQPTNQKRFLELKLNNEEAGTTADTSVLSKKLEEVFKMLADEGVFKPRTNEVEKTVHLAGDRSVSAESKIMPHQDVGDILTRCSLRRL